MKSMTGFATFLSKDKKKEFKLKSVNNRFFEFRLHAPQDYMEHESEIRKLVQKTVLRGSVDLFIQRNQKDSKSNAAVVIDEKLLKDFVKSSAQVAESLNLSKDLTLSEALKLSGALKSESFSGEKIDKKVLLSDIESLAKKFDKERKREGEALKKEVAALLGDLDQERQKIFNLAESLPEDIRKRFKQKMSQLKEEIDPQRLNQEILFFIDKSDIKEELVRLKEHIGECQKVLSSKTSQGKKLDFYAQELFREMNTVGSKSSSVKITQEVMQGKAIIEKIRQQVQNIE